MKVPKLNYKHIDIVFITFNVSISIVSLFVSSYLLGNESSFLIGAMTFIFFSLIYIDFKLNEQTDNYRKQLVKFDDQVSKFDSMLVLIDSLLGVGSFREVLLKQSLLSLNRITKKGVSAESGEHWDLWMDCIESSKTSWIVTNYAKTDEYWNTDFSDRIVNIQRAKIKNGQRVMRLFIFDNIDEMYDQSKILNMQLKLGTEIRYLIKKEFINKAHFKDRIRKLDTFDFGIVDGSWVFRLFLNKDRKIVRINAANDKILLKEATYLMNEMVKLSKLYEEV